MSDLRALQRRMAAALRRATPAARDAGSILTAEQLVQGNARLRPVERLEIYREQVFARHVACLEEDYPLLADVLGERAFALLVAAYREALPPPSYALRELGARLPEHLRLSGAAPWHVELARLEWALIESDDAPSLPPLELSRLQAAGEAIEDARIGLCPSLRLLTLAHPVHRLREAQDERTYRAAVQGAPHPEETLLLVYRRDGEARLEEASAAEVRVLSLLASGLALGEALDRVLDELTRVHGEDSAAVAVLGEAGVWFRRWVEAGLVRALSFPPRAR